MLNPLVLVKLWLCVSNRFVNVCPVRVSSVVQLVPPSFEPRNRQSRGSRSGESFAADTVYCVTTHCAPFVYWYWIQLARVDGLLVAKSSHLVAVLLSKALVAASPG